MYVWIYRQLIIITDYGYRYIYSTEYVNPTKELYNKLEKYIDKKYRNYDDFVNGRQVVVFLQDAPDGTYDDTLKAGDTLIIIIISCR